MLPFSRAASLFLNNSLSFCNSTISTLLPFSPAWLQSSRDNFLLRNKARTNNASVIYVGIVHSTDVSTKIISKCCFDIPISLMSRVLCSQLKHKNSVTCTEAFIVPASQLIGISTNTFFYCDITFLEFNGPYYLSRQDEASHDWPCAQYDSRIKGRSVIYTQ